MKRYILIAAFIFTCSHIAEAQLGSYAGAFSRMGFGARGMSMGNAVSSDVFGDVSGIYNPALATFQTEGKIDVGYTFLSLDRRLNYVGFTKKFKLPNQDQGGAGITLAWINAGVSDIDGRDNDTRQIGLFSTFENEFYLGTSFILSDRLSLGVGFKLYYAKLFEEVTSSSFAIDLGGVYKANKNLAIALTFKDLGAKYKWQTTSIYGSNGNSTEDKFPSLLELSGTYLLPENYGTVSVGFLQHLNPDSESFTDAGSVSTKSNNSVVRIGVETNLIKQVKLRAGLDRIDFSADDLIGNLKPSFGFGLDKNFSKSINLGVDYSVQLEPFSHDLIQNIGVVFKFK
ncbi:MAG: PorV/PorQ family protein [Bacteroidetes bacterium]|nr:PorV/PorQ family protein [Bacteroidota bacterium]